MGFTKPIVIDARGHMLGRLASIVAKTILQGQNVVIVRCEGINISGNFYRNKLKYLEYLKKRCNVLRLGQSRKYCNLNRLAHEVGWKYQKVIGTLEARRKVKSNAFYDRKRKLTQLREQARKNVAGKVQKYQDIISSW